jgi:hypothetical protein
MIGNHLGDYFDSDMYNQSGEGLIFKWNRLKGSFEKFLKDFREIKLPQIVVNQKLEEDTDKIKRLDAEFQQERNRIRQGQREYRDGKVNEGPGTNNLDKMHKRVVEEILKLLMVVEQCFKQIHLDGFDFYERR